MSRDYGTENRNGCKWTNVYTCHLESYDFTSGLQIVTTVEYLPIIIAKLLREAKLTKL